MQKKIPRVTIANQAFVLLILLMLINSGCSSKDKRLYDKKQIIIEADISKYFYSKLQQIFTLRDRMKIQYSPLDYAESSPSLKFATENLIDSKVRWIINSDKPILVAPPFGITTLLNPGDSLHITYLTETPRYSGSDTKTMEMLNALMLTNEKLVAPRKKHSYNVETISDFFEWNDYLDKKTNLQLPIFDSFKHTIQKVKFDYYKSSTICAVEGDRINAFIALYDTIQSGYPGLSLTNLVSIWDTTQINSSRNWLSSISSFCGSMSDFYTFNRMNVWRKFGFDSQNDSLKIKETRMYLYYTNAKQNFNGLLRERLMTYILDEHTIGEMGVKNPMTQLMLKDYYNQPGFPEYKKLVRNLETMAKQ